MNREIKFRTWNGVKMEYDILVGKLGVFYAQGMSEKDTACISEFNTKLETQCMQFTGMRDVNNVEIYECDIVKFKGYSGNADYVGSVVYDEKDMCFKFRDIKPFIYADKSYNHELRPRVAYHSFEVIGNIFQNP